MQRLRRERERAAERGREGGRQKGGVGERRADEREAPSAIRARPAGKSGQAEKTHAKLVPLSRVSLL